jgi:hypothetical protein
MALKIENFTDDKVSVSVVRMRFDRASARFLLLDDT